jgi:hypothetical protein
MNLIPIDWFEAQNLLLKLVQTLTPWTGREISSSFFLSKRFAYSLKNDPLPTHIRSSVKLLTTLRSAQQMVEEWTSEPQKETKSSMPPKSREEPKEEKPKPIFARQAQRVVDEVQEAIGVLVTSANFKNPQEEPLRNALKKLKPHLDRLIEEVTHEGMHSPSDHPTPFRPSLPISSREHLLRKLARKEEGWEVQEKQPPLERKSPMLPKAPKRGEEEAPILKKEAPPAPQSDKEPILKGEGMPELVRQENIEKTSLPVLPFVPPPKTFTAPDKKKKKRQGFWFRERDGSKKDD